MSDIFSTYNELIRHLNKLNEILSSHIPSMIVSERQYSLYQTCLKTKMKPHPYVEGCLLYDDDFYYDIRKYGYMCYRSESNRYASIYSIAQMFYWNWMSHFSNPIDSRMLSVFVAIECSLYHKDIFTPEKIEKLVFSAISNIKKPKSTKHKKYAIDMNYFTLKGITSQAEAREIIKRELSLHDPIVERLIETITKNPKIKSSYLAHVLGISKPTLYRLVKKLSHRVQRVGKGKDMCWVVDGDTSVVPAEDKPEWKMKKHERQYWIVESIRKDPKVTFETLSRVLDVSSCTIKTDIDILKKQGIVRRVGSLKGGHWEIIN